MNTTVTAIAAACNETEWLIIKWLVIGISLGAIITLLCCFAWAYKAMGGVDHE